MEVEGEVVKVGSEEDSGFSLAVNSAVAALSPLVQEVGRFNF